MLLYIDKNIKHNALQLMLTRIEEAFYITF
jgi:hypothetical protein